MVFSTLDYLTVEVVPACAFAHEAAALVQALRTTAFAPPGHKLDQAGVTVEMHVAAAAQHVWPMMFPDLPESQRALRAIATFVREGLA